MSTYFDLKDFFLRKKYNLIILADAEPFVHERQNNELVVKIPAGGVSVALEPVARASSALFIARGKTKEDKENADENGLVHVNHRDPYTLKRIFLSEEELSSYYYGFSNQILWPLCHVAFEAPVFNPEWWEAYKEVNQKFANAILKQPKGPKLIWINDYQLSLVPSMLPATPERILGFFWHIPWPTWEIFRIMPRKKEILESLLHCDFLAFHRGYQARNFFDCVRRELEARIDDEKGTIHYAHHTTTVTNLPMGIDTDVIRDLSEPETTDFLSGVVKAILGTKQTKVPYNELFQKTKVILGVDRLDYTKGLVLRLKALKRFFEKYPENKGKVTYLGFVATSRKEIPSYAALEKAISEKASEINNEFGTAAWQPVNLVPGIFSRQEIITLYKNSRVCLVTPLDDGMNLVSKEFIMAASTATNPGMLILSQFAGSAIDLTQALIINPYDVEETADAIQKALTMKKEEREQRISRMAATLDSHNVYSWAQDFLQKTEESARENRKIKI